MPKPIIYLTFANDYSQVGEGYLQKLTEERSNLRPMFSKDERFEVESDPDASVDNVIRYLQAPENLQRIQIWHYAGHGSPQGIYLHNDAVNSSDPVAGGDGLAQIVGQSQQNLQLVFLNACSTEDQVNALLRAGVRNVVATSQSINDAVAVDFAMRFYTALTNGQSIKNAFDQAESYIKIKHNSNDRDSFRKLIFKEPATPTVVVDELPWKLHSKDAEDAKWRMAEARIIQGSVKVFLAYAEEDAKLKDKLVRSLAVPIKRSRKISTFEEANVDASEEQEKLLTEQLYQCDLALLLISDNFLNSDLCYNFESIAMQRRAKGEMRVIPIRLKSFFTDDNTLEFAKLVGLPNAPNRPKEISGWSDQDEVMTHVAAGIMRVVDSMLNLT